MSLIQIGIVDKTKKLDPSLVHAAAVALNVQVVRDLPTQWPITATVQYLSDPAHIPAGVWPVFLVAKLPPGEGGFHMDKHNQPYAEVIASHLNDSWTIDASHEILEMLVDPYGNRMQSSKAIQIQGMDVVDAPGQFSYLVESADPCEADNFGYQIQGIAVSDFITPHFYDPVETAGVKYSFTGAIKRPRQVLPGGYISYVNLATNNWEQILWVDPNAPPTKRVIGSANGAKSLRMWIDGEMSHYKEGLGGKLSRDQAVLKAGQDSRAELSALAKTRGTMFA